MKTWNAPMWMMAAFVAGIVFTNGWSAGLGAKGDDGLSAPGIGTRAAVTNSAFDALTKRVAALEKKLKKVTVASNGDIRITGVNLRILSGLSGSHAGPNGKGNLIIGYDEDSGDDIKNGSHNLVIGGYHSYTSTGGLVAGNDNYITGQGATVTGGQGNTASGQYASVTGGAENEASAFASNVSGGSFNAASATYASVAGGGCNTASGESSFVGGGNTNAASGSASSVSGGNSNAAGGDFATVSGGILNKAFGNYTAILGGLTNLAGDPDELVHTVGQYATISGGNFNTASANTASVSGGYNNVASGVAASVSGGSSNIASGARSSVSGGEGCDTGSTNFRWTFGDQTVDAGCNTLQTADF
jgi:hypothetical protein